MNQKLRFERKFVIDPLSKEQAITYLKLTPHGFREMYEPRVVSSIYFDTQGMDCYFDNINGNKLRKKYRIRWYGSLEKIKSPVFEIKIKDGLLGEKIKLELKDFKIENISNICKSGYLKDNLPELNSLNLYPTLVVSYKRSYYESFDRKIRFTIDEDLKYIKYDKYFTSASIVKSEDIVLEIKYSYDDASLVSNLLDKFPLRLTKYSKYIQGIENCY